MYKEIKKCRICGNADIVSILHLGEMCLTGVFPKTRNEKVTRGPLELVKCVEGRSDECCGLVQLWQSYDTGEMYGENYGYRSGLNDSMVRHLNDKVKGILKLVEPGPGDIVVDIGSNDATLLKAYAQCGATLVGFDPTGIKFKDHYPEHVELIADFFNCPSFKKRFGARKAEIITSIAMLYDLEDPLGFVKDVYDILADNGIWVFEQSYMPTMLKMNSYDTACHEHLEYYRLKQIKWMTDRVGFKIVDIEFNDINGGSISITVAKSSSLFRENRILIEKILAEEERDELGTIKPYDEFRARVYKNREELRRFVAEAKDRGEKIFGYGASTKGNVLLQFCGFTEKDIPFIAEVNEDKFGRYTPGTLIPIISEARAKEMRPDYFLVLPWHFKKDFLDREREYLNNGGKLLLPLPEVEVKSADGLLQERE